MFSSINTELEHSTSSLQMLNSYGVEQISIEDAAGMIRSGDNVYVGGNAASPQTFLTFLAKRKNELRNVSVFHMLLMGNDPFGENTERDHLRHVSFFVGNAVRKAIQFHSADYIPVFLSEIPSLFYKDIIPIDIVYVMVSPPNEEGYVSLGVDCTASKAATERGKVVIAQINQNMPFVYGEALIPLSKLNYIVEHSESLCELEKPEIGEIEQKIAQIISPLIEDGSTLQLGIGGIPNAIMSALDGKKDLGVHTEMFSDGLMEMIQKGVITNNKKTVHHGLSIATFILGSKALYEFVHHNKRIKLLPSDATNNPFLISQNDKMISINSAIEVDLSGQVCSDSIGTQIYSGFGGQLDFVRGASASKGGKAIIALPSMTKNGKYSRIVPTLKQGAGVVTTRADIRYIATEYGIVSLMGKTLRQRAEALISISHPNFRNELEEWFRISNQSHQSKEEL
ncbi:MAG: acetyl-CoA hydrolase/transferase C-terminal domain-containing protein [Bacteroidota bacterium]|nr:acetyl-CoA hydrolase/transferase C-terminal domain-containing protein [Bacteroidota bacterium]